MNPFPLILSAPSGGGKTTISRMLLERRPDVGYSVSCTTRAPRSGETNGRDYFFLTRSEFVSRRANGEFAESAEVHGNLYGTLRDQVDAVLGQGRHVIMDIDVQGARQFATSYPESVMVFILPPSADALMQRLAARRTESGDGLPTESGTKPPSPKIFTATLDKSLLADAAEVETIEKSGGATLVDARPASFFLGKEKAPASQAYGRIPGAINIDSAEFYDPQTNRLKPKAELEKLASHIPSGPVVSYCNTGHWASTDWFVMHELLGHQRARLYAGSMVEWTSNASRPIESSRTKWDDLKKALGLGS